MSSLSVGGGAGGAAAAATPAAAPGGAAAGGGLREANCGRWSLASNTALGFLTRRSLSLSWMMPFEASSSFMCRAACIEPCSRKGITANKKAPPHQSAWEFPPDAPTTAHDCTNHVAPNLWFHPIGEFRSVLVANTIPPQVHSVCTCSVPPSRAETLAAFSHRAPRSPPKGLGPDGSRPRARTRVYRRLRLHATCSVGLLLAPFTAVCARLCLPES